MKKDYKTAPGYFRDNPKYGRTTKLIRKATGETVASFLGVITLTECYETFKTIKP